jgi:hypothetical protein
VIFNRIQEIMTSLNREENFATFIAEKTDYYLAKWDIFDNSNEKVSWNWAAFFFSAYWMMYRKMYAPAITVFVGIRIAKYMVALGGGEFYRLVAVVGLLATGALGNWIYYVYASRKIADIADTAGTDDPSVIGRTVREVGGTSWVWVIMLMIIGSFVDKILKYALLKREISIENFDADTFWDIL